MFKNYTRGRCYVIAEIGGNFTTFTEAKRLIDDACACGVDAVKLQTYRAATVASKKAMFDMENTGNISQYELFQKYEIDEQLHEQVFEYIDRKGLDWFSTPAHETDAEMLESLGVGAYKIGSDDAVNIPFLKNIARKGKPILLSTGMCTMQEVRESVSAILEEGNDGLYLLHAITSYPTHPEHVNLLSMVSLKREFPMFEVGYSDHTIGTTACVCAAAMGAALIEKHFTYDKNAAGPDHILSADPQEMKTIVDAIREFEILKGTGIKMPAACEASTRINNRKSLVLEKDIDKGEIITGEHLSIKRPGYGIAPRYLDRIVGKQANKDLRKEDVLTWEDVS